MAYEPTNWKAGDTVTSAKLNKIENELVAINNNELIIPIFTYDEEKEKHICNITFDELTSAIQNGKKCIGCIERFVEESNEQNMEDIFYILAHSSTEEYEFIHEHTSDHKVIYFTKENEEENIEFGSWQMGPQKIYINNNMMNRKYNEIESALVNFQGITFLEYIQNTNCFIIYHFLGADNNNKNIYLMKYSLESNPTPTYVVYHANSDNDYPVLVV